jgi:7,8-dihydropterin-6-yl-methyl-4-(beta-D-ribofuranosyl)aminobenzene 5'-phosphate synthase
MPAVEPVDRLEFQVLIDNVTDSLSTAPPNVLLEWPALMRAGMRQLSGKCQCCANHGLSLVVKAFRGAQSHAVLFDAGPVEFAVEYNGTRLGIDFGSVNAVVLSHGHWDHAGGLPMALELIGKANGNRPIPCYLHPGMFRQRALPLPGGGLLPIREIPSLDELGAKGAVPVVTTEQQERFLATHVKGKGIVVFTACSHAGVVNVLKHAQSSFPSTPLYAVAGGFHLSGGNENIIAESVRDIGNFGLQMICPGHCTGWRAVNALVTAYGDAVVAPLAVGKLFTF